MTPCPATVAAIVEWLQDEASKREGKAVRLFRPDQYIDAAVLRRIANRLADGAPFMEMK